MGRSPLFGGCWPEAATFLAMWTFPWDRSQCAAGVVSGGSERAGRGGERTSPALGRDLPSLRHTLCWEQATGSSTHSWEVTIKGVDIASSIGWFANTNAHRARQVMQTELAGPCFPARVAFCV